MQGSKSSPNLKLDWSLLRGSQSKTKFVHRIGASDFTCSHSNLHCNCERFACKDNGLLCIRTRQTVAYGSQSSAQMLLPQSTGSSIEISLFNPIASFNRMTPGALSSSSFTQLLLPNELTWGRRLDLGVTAMCLDTIQCQHSQHVALSTYQTNLHVDASHLCRREMAKAFVKYKPDIIVSVHPLMQHVPLRVLRSRGLLHRIPFTTVITDLDTCHPTW